MGTSGGTPVGGNPFDPFEKYYRIEGLESIRDEETSPKPFKEEENTPLIGFLLLMFRKMFDYLIDREERGLSKTEEKNLIAHLKGFQGQLKKLMEEDHSQDIPFLEDFSKHWQEILELSILFKKLYRSAKIIKQFIRKIASYPEGKEYTLAYYLSEYAGEKWIPFPYLEMIKELHLKHQKNPSLSPLTEWAELLQQAVASFR